jgi:hypothetical protein
MLRMAGDAPILLDLLGQVAPGEPMASVRADGVCNTKACHIAINGYGAQAIISPSKNAQP